MENRLKELIKLRYGTISEFSREIGIPNSTINSVLNRGIQNATLANVCKICSALDISTDGLASGAIVPIEADPTDPEVQEINLMDSNFFIF